MTNEMTAEEAIKILNDIDFCNGNVCDSCHMGYRCSDINKVKTMAIKALEQRDVLEKIRAEINTMPCAITSMREIYVNRDKVISILDKYKAESEDTE